MSDDDRSELMALQGQVAALQFALTFLIEALPDSVRLAQAIDARLEQVTAVMLPTFRSETALQSFLEHREVLLKGLLARNARSAG